MDPPPLSTTPPPLAISSPRDLRLMCSYGGHIVPRPHDKSLCYVGGDTKIIAVDRRSTSLSDLTSRLSRTFFNHRVPISFTIKYQLPNEDLDSLISVTTDEDFDNLIDEYDRVCLASGRLRLFLFPNKYDSGSSSTMEVGSIFDSMRSEDWFLSGVLKGVFSDAQSMNCLIGSINGMASNSNNNIDTYNLGSIEFDASQTEFNALVGGKNTKQSGGAQLEQSAVPDSPIVGTNSSFGSTSSAHALANLPPIRVHVEDGAGGGIRVPDQKLGIEEQFTQINIAPTQNQYEGFAGLSSPPMPTLIHVSTPTSAIPISPPATAAGGGGGGGGEYQNRVFYDEERLEQVIPVVAFGRPPQPQAVLQTMPLQPQQKVTGGVELPSPDSVSSDSSLTNLTYRQNPMIYHDQIAQAPMNMTDPNTRIPIQQQVPETGYVMQPHLDQRQQQQVSESGYVMQPQLEQRQQQLHQQQIIHPSAQYIHHHPSRQMPISSYYPGYPSQQFHQHQQQLYFMNPRPQQATYNLAMQQPNFSEPLPTIPLSIPQTPNPAMVNTPTAYGTVQNAPPSKAELPGGVYRAPQLVQVAPNQHQQQFVSYSQVPHPSQSIPPSSGVTSNYAYGYADPTHAQAQMYFTQSPYGQPVPGQYQTNAAAVGLPEASSQPLAEK